MTKINVMKILRDAKIQNDCKDGNICDESWKKFEWVIEVIEIIDVYYRGTTNKEGNYIS